jgi:predicted ATPase
MTSLALNRLSRRECVALVEEVTNDKALPAEVLDQIVVKTDGIPLFVEELTKAMLDSGLLEERADRFELKGPLTPLAIPASLQDALTARLDRLVPVKEIAQLAATIGRSFNHELLLPVSQLSENELGDALAQLVEAGLIYRRSIGADITYEFKHALVQETAYHSLLKSKRLQYHQRIADAIAEKYPDVVETQPELLAHHYTEANMASEAIDYWCKAGQRAVARSAYTEAIAHLQKGLELVDGLPSSHKRIQQELDLHIALGPALIVAHGPASQEVERTYTRARELCQQLGSTDQLFSVTWGLWMANQFNARFDKAQALADETLALAERQADAGLKLQAHHAIWTTLRRT